MKLTSIVGQLASRQRSRVALGVGRADASSLQKLVDASREVEGLGLARITLVGEINVKDIDCRETEEPEKEILHQLESGEVQAAVRGTLPAESFIRLTRGQYHIDELYRIGLLETYDKKDFFFGPVGIDEGATISQKLRFISEGKKLLHQLGVTAKVGVLSGGRREDAGRSERIDVSLAEGELVASMARETEAVETSHYSILIEEAVREGANLIVAPDGISGNLVYRTLVHLGGGKSHGALYCGLKDIIVDTSRVAPTGEYVGAMTLASAMVQTSRPL
jgi:putative methanogen marker protein 4